MMSLYCSFNIADPLPTDVAPSSLISYVHILLHIIIVTYQINFTIIAKNACHVFYVQVKNESVCLNSYVFNRSDHLTSTQALLLVLFTPFPFYAFNFLRLMRLAMSLKDIKGLYNYISVH